MGAIYHFSPSNYRVTRLPLRPPPLDLVSVDVGPMNQYYLISRSHAAQGCYDPPIVGMACATIGLLFGNPYRYSWELRQ